MVDAMVLDSPFAPSTVRRFRSWPRIASTKISKFAVSGMLQIVRRTIDREQDRHQRHLGHRPHPKTCCRPLRAAKGDSLMRTSTRPLHGPTRATSSSCRSRATTTTAAPACAFAGDFLGVHAGAESWALEKRESVLVPRCRGTRRTVGCCRRRAAPPAEPRGRERRRPGRPRRARARSRAPWRPSARRGFDGYLVIFFSSESGGGGIPTRRSRCAWLLVGGPGSGAARRHNCNHNNQSDPSALRANAGATRMGAGGGTKTVRLGGGGGGCRTPRYYKPASTTRTATRRQQTCVCSCTSPGRSSAVRSTATVFGKSAATRETAALTCRSLSESRARSAAGICSSRSRQPDAARARSHKSGVRSKIKTAPGATWARSQRASSVIVDGVKRSAGFRTRGDGVPPAAPRPAPETRPGVGEARRAVDVSVRQVDWKATRHRPERVDLAVLDDHVRRTAGRLRAPSRRFRRAGRGGEESWVARGRAQEVHGRESRRRVARRHARRRRV